MTYSLYAQWVRQDLLGHALSGRKLPWFLLGYYGWTECRDPTVAEFDTYLARTMRKRPQWLEEATDARRGIVRGTA